MSSAAAAGQSTASRRSPGYQIALTALLSLNFGFVLFDRNATNFLMPDIQPELGLNNTEVGLLSSGLSLTWALAAFGIGVLSDRTGSRKRLLILATLAFSICSFGSGLATTFALLLMTRMLMGAAEGGIMPISQSLIAADVDASTGRGHALVTRRQGQARFRLLSRRAARAQRLALRDPVDAARRLSRRHGDFSIGSLLVSLGGAVILLAIVGFFRKRRHV